MRDEPNDLFIEPRRRGIGLDIRNKAPPVFPVGQGFNFAGFGGQFVE
jgi:hypothetical protein